MPISQTYYLNAPSLGSATAVFLDGALTQCAPNGYYSNGTIVRQQVGCVLLPQQTCPSCALPCNILPSSVGTSGVFSLSSEMGAATGAIIIRFNPFNTPVGFSALFNSVVYNKFSSPVYGLQSISPSVLPIYLGNTTTSGCDLVGLSPISLNEYQYDGSSFVPLGTVQSVSVTLPQITGNNSPGNCVMVIPKTMATPSIVDFSVYAACASPSFNLSIECPVQLNTFESSPTTDPDPTLVCSETFTEEYRVAYVNGGGGTLGLYDWVFYDDNGEFILPDGYYKSPNCPVGYDYFEVYSGVIVEFYVCP